MKKQDDADSKQASADHPVNKFEKGARIFWRYARPGSSVVERVEAGIFVKEGEKRFLIEIRERAPYENLWNPRLKWVEKSTIIPRVLPSSAFLEPMQLETHGFVISFCKKEVRSVVFKDGVFYGTVDGYETGSPCSSEEDAVASAFYALHHGGYEVSLLSGIECYEGWLHQEMPGDLLEKAKKEISELKKRLMKLLDAGLGKISS